MFNQATLNTIIARFAAFTKGHYLLEQFTHGDLQKMLELLGEKDYPLMHVQCTAVNYSVGERSFSFDIVLADIPRDKEYAADYQKEIISDMIQIGEDLISEIRNGSIIFGDDVILGDQIQFTPFIADYTHTLSGITLSIDMAFPYNWNACDIPADWSIQGSGSGSGSGSYGLILRTNGTPNAVQSILDLVNGSNITIEDLGDGRVRINSTGGSGSVSWGSILGTLSNQEDLQDALDLKVDISSLAAVATTGDYADLINTPSLSAVALSGEYSDLLNPPTIPTLTSELTNDSGFITSADIPPIPTLTSELTNDSGFITIADVPTQLRDLTDVDISSPQQNDTLLFNAASNEFINGQLGAVAYSNDYTDLDNLPTLPPTIGDMLKSVYDTDNDGIVDKAETIQIIVRNSTGSILNKGSVVYLSGATGNRPNAVLADATDESTSSKTIGIVVANISNNSEGQVAVNGTLHDLNTSAFADGSTLWLSEVAGQMQENTPPAEPAHSVFIGYVARSHPNLGRIVLAIQNGYELDELHGVKITSPSQKNLLSYNSASTLWENKAIDSTWLSDRTQVGGAVIGLANPSAISYIRINADNSISTLTLAQLKSDLGMSRALLGSDISITAAATTLSDITGLSFPIVAGNAYKFRAELYVTASASNVGLKLSVNSSVAVTAIVFRAVSASSTESGQYVHNGFALDSTSGVNVGAIRSTNYATIEGILVANNSGTAVMRFGKAAANVGTLSIKANSLLEYQTL